MTPNHQNEAAAGELRPQADVYLAWLQAAKDSEHALHAWLDGSRCDQAVLYAAYRAALDREETAASDLERRSGPAVEGRGVYVVGRIRRHRFAAPIVHEMPQPGLGG